MIVKEVVVVVVAVDLAAVVVVVVVVVVKVVRPYRDVCSNFGIRHKGKSQDRR